MARIVERGTHETLLTRGGLYSQLYDVQLREQEEFEARLLEAQEHNESNMKQIETIVENEFQLDNKDRTDRTNRTDSIGGQDRQKEVMR